MDRPGRIRAGVRAGILAVLLVGVPSYGASQAAPSFRASAASAPRGEKMTTGVVVGSAWRSDSTPYRQARLRLRNVQDGRGIARTIADDEGQFRFDQVDPGPYVVELLSTTDKVLAVSDLFGITPGDEIITVVRLGTTAPGAAGFFRNAAAAAIAAASTLGVTAVGSNGQPVSAQ